MAATPDLRPTVLPTCATTDPDTLPTDIWTGTDTASTTPDMETSTPPPTPPSERFPPDTEPDMAVLSDTTLDMGPLDIMPDMGLPDMEDMAASTNINVMILL